MSSVDSGRSQLSKVSDLHIFVVPLDLWLDKYRTAFNNIALESVSAGFVRISPETPLHRLRECIEDQLGEDIIPEDFIFLRSVGRCMAVVKQNQEHLLRAADFLPPVAYSPEIFLLPGTHDTFARPASDASNVVIATHGYTTAGLSSTQYVHLPAISQQHANQQLIAQPQYGETESTDYHDNMEQQQMQQQENIQQAMSERQNSGDSTMTQQQQKAKRSSLEGDKQSVHFNDEEEQMSGYRGDNEHRSSGENKELGLSPRAVEHVRSKNKKNKAKKGSSDSSGSSIPEELRTVKIIQPQVVHSLPVQGPDGFYISPPTPIPSGRVIASPVPGHRREKAPLAELHSDKDTTAGHHSKKGTPRHGVESDKGGHSKKGSKKKRRSRSRSPSAERQKREQESAPVEMGKLAEGGEAEEDVIPTLEDVEDRSKYSQFPSPDKSARSRNPYESELDSGIADDFATPPQGLEDPQHGRHGKRDSMQDKPALGGLYEDADGFGGKSGQGSTHGADDHECLGLGDELQGEVRGLEQGDGLAGRLGQGDGLGAGQDGDHTKGKDSKINKKTKRAPPKKAAKKTDDLDQSFDIPKIQAPPPVPMPNLGDKPLERDTASARDQKQAMVEELRGELRRAKNERVEMEKQREQKVRRAKSLQTQTLQKRNQSKNIWKKKFFDEKRKTVPLEEQVNRLRYDMEIQHKAMLSFLETKKDRDGNKGGQDRPDKCPSQKSNQLMLLARLQNEIEELKRKVEETKMRLASEMKMRDAAQNELKQLREDLLDKKINLTLTKSQKSLANLTNPENITA